MVVGALLLQFTPLHHHHSGVLALRYTIFVRSNRCFQPDLLLFFTDDPCDTANRNVKSGLALWIQQLIALLIKRFHHARRGKKGFVSQILLPAIFVAAAMAFSLLRPPRGVLPPLKLSPSQYGEPNYVFIANLRKNFNFTKRIVEAAVKGPGLGKF